MVLVMHLDLDLDLRFLRLLLYCIDMAFGDQTLKESRRIGGN
jgi:hypothetical protein